MEPSGSINPTTVPSETPSFTLNPSSVPTLLPSFSFSPSDEPPVSRHEVKNIPSRIPSKAPSNTRPTVIIQSFSSKKRNTSTSNLCLEPTRLSNGSSVKLKLCDQSANQDWIRTNRGQFKHAENPSLCLKNKSGSLKVGYCGSKNRDQNSSRFGFNPFDGSIFLKKNPSLLLTQMGFEKTVKLLPWEASNLLQQWAIITNDTSSPQLLPISGIVFESFIPGNFCIEAPENSVQGTPILFGHCTRTNMRQKWVYTKDQSFQNAAFESFCLAESDELLVLRFCNKDKANSFVYDYFDSTLSSTNGKGIVTIMNDDFEENGLLQVLPRNLSSHPNGGQEWSLMK